MLDHEPERVPAAERLADAVKGPGSDRVVRVLRQMGDVDRAVYAAIAATPTPQLDVPIRRLSRLADNSQLWIGVAVAIAVLGGRAGRRAAARGLLTLAVNSAAVNLGVKSLYPRQRPDRAGAGVPPARHIEMPSTRSFPSGHSASGFAFAASVGRDLPALALPLRFLAGAVAYSRVHTGVHYPSDALIGSIIGASVAEAVGGPVDRVLCLRLDSLFPMGLASDVVTDLAPGGVLRAAINMGNPVLAQGTPAAPAGVCVDIAREIAARLDVPVEFACFGAARYALAAVMTGQAGICFLAIEPAREADVTFTAPYVLIEGVYAVPGQSPLTTADEVDSAGVRIGVNRESAYDLFLSRTLRHATVIRGAAGTQEFLTRNLEAVAGIRQPLTEFVRAHPGLRLIEEPFMQIRQAVGTAKTKRPGTSRFLHGLVEELKASGFVAAALSRSGQAAAVAPAA